MNITIWKAAGLTALVIATLSVATYCLLAIHANRTRNRQARKLLRAELSLPVILASVTGVLIGELGTHWHIEASLDQLQTFMIPILSGMASQSLVRRALDDEPGKQRIISLAPAVLALAIGTAVSGASTYL